MLKTSKEEAPIVCSKDGQSKPNKSQFIGSNEHSDTTCTKKYGDKSCQVEKSDMQPVKPVKDMQSNRPAIPIQNKMTKKSKIVPQDDDKNCQPTRYYGLMCADKKCQATKCYKKVDKQCQASNMQPVKPHIDMQSREPAVQSSFKKKHVPLSKDNNCKSTKISKKSMCSDKNCQENINLWPVKPEMNMQLSKPAVLYQYRRLCNDKNCQSTRCYRKRNYDKNCQ